MNQWRYVHTGEYYSVMKRSEVQAQATMRKTLEHRMLSERRDPRGHTVWDPISVKCPHRQMHGEKADEQLSGAERREWGVTAHRKRESLGVKNMSWN